MADISYYLVLARQAEWIQVYKIVDQVWVERQTFFGAKYQALGYHAWVCAGRPKASRFRKPDSMKSFSSPSPGYMLDRQLGESLLAWIQEASDEKREEED